MMDFQPVVVTYKSSTATRLGKWQDWGAIDDVNPEADGKQPSNKKQIAPRANFKVKNDIHTNELRLNEGKDVALKILDENLKITMGDQFRQHLMAKTTERAKMKSLFEQMKPVMTSIKADLKSECELLKGTAYGKSINGEHPIFVTSEEDSFLALHDALQPIHPVIAIFRVRLVNNHFNAERPVRLVYEIRAWQTFLQSKKNCKISIEIWIC
ncbi:hypothetical protein Golomagni_03545 [Golovinomyces magnicellulatus]|nr:hypothetical protein Golomagni_03545 [Golovinomyces magnicellulatus]